MLLSLKVEEPQYFTTINENIKHTLIFMLSIQLVLSLARELGSIWVKGRMLTTNGQRTDHPLIGIRDQNSPSE